MSCDRLDSMCHREQRTPIAIACGVATQIAPLLEWARPVGLIAAELVPTGDQNAMRDS